MKKLFIPFLSVVMLIAIATTSFSQIIKGTYAIKNVQTGSLLRIKDANKANGTPLVSYHPVNWKCMTWDFKHVEGLSYQLKNLFSGKTFQPKKEAGNGVALEEQPLVTEQPTQLYEFLPVSKDIYLVRLKGSELYLTPADANGTDNSEIILAAKQTGKTQQWTIYEQDPEY